MVRKTENNGRSKPQGCPVIMVAALSLIVIAGCASSKPTRPPATFTTEPWNFGKQSAFKLTSEHYVIYTTQRDAELRECLPDFVETAYEYYSTIMPPAHPPAERLPVFLFTTRGQFESFTRRLTGPRAEVYLKIRNGGYSENGVSVIEFVTHEQTFPLFGHEGFHQYVSQCVGAEIPAWLNEGLAVCCEGQRWGEIRLKTFDPWYNPQRGNDLADALLEARLHPLRKLLATHAGEIIQGSPKSVATYYAQVWGLVLFLREGAQGRYAAGYQKLLAALTDGTAEQHARAAHISSAETAFNFGEELFRAFIGPDLDAIEHEYQGFLRERFLGSKPLVPARG